MPSNPKEIYIGAHVTVFYRVQGSVTDSGIVLYLDDHWVEVQKSSGDRLLVPTSAIRLIKLLSRANRGEPDAELLRAVDGERSSQDNEGPE